MRHTKTILPLTLVLILLTCYSYADWDSANGRGLIPYWENGDDWYTLLIFVNGSEETGDIINIRFYNQNGGPDCFEGRDMYSIRAKEMLLFSTTPAVPTWIPTLGNFGYIMFRTDEGGFIHAYCVIYNQMTGSGYVVPAVHQDRGF